MNLPSLPNLITVSRIALAPIVALLPFVPSWSWRLAAFGLYLVVAISDYWDGWVARRYNVVSDTGKLLDPLADKIFLVGVLVAMYVLQVPLSERNAQPWLLHLGDAGRFPFSTIVGSEMFNVPLPFWVIVVVLAREVAMTVFRQVAQRRGIVIGASRVAKWKTGFQFVWMGAAYAWFAALTLAHRFGWTTDGENAWWHAFSLFATIVGVASMVGAVVLAMWSLVEYARRYGPQLTGAAAPR